MRSPWTEAYEDMQPPPSDEERAETRRRLEATRPHAHKASPLLTTTELDANGNTRLLETCACGCQRYVSLKGCRRNPGSWT